MSDLKDYALAQDMKIRSLKAENAKLKDDAIDYLRANFESDAIEAWKKHCNKLEAENSRLRAAFNGDVGSLADCVSECDALKDLNAELMAVLEDIQSMNNSSLWEQNDTVSYIAQLARQANNKAREVMDEM